jgi:proteasome activator subunit 4
MHALYRRRSELDDHLIKDLADLSLSPYTRLRRCGCLLNRTQLSIEIMQTCTGCSRKRVRCELCNMSLLVPLTHSSQYYVRSTKLILPSVYDALAKGSDPDRMKGALYILWSKGIGQISKYFVECYC